MRLPFEVLVVVRREGAFLVLHRAPQFDAYWHLVSGAQEPGETPLEAAARELREEVGLDAAASIVDLGQTYVYPLAGESEFVRSRFDESVVSEVVVTCFAADAPAGWEPTLNEEHDAYRWCGADEAAQLLYWPEPRELVRSLDEMTAEA